MIASEPRTLAPPGRRLAEITANRELGAYRLISARDEAGPRDPCPGQFYMLAAADRWGGDGERPYLPRAFSYARAHEDGTLDFLLEAVRALCAERDVPAQLALESGMACGYGACFGCVVPTRSGYVRLCVDGPVLDAAELESALVPGAGH